MLHDYDETKSKDTKKIKILADPTPFMLYSNCPFNYFLVKYCCIILNDNEHQKQEKSNFLLLALGVENEAIVILTKRELCELPNVTFELPRKDRFA